MNLLNLPRSSQRSCDTIYTCIYYVPTICTILCNDEPILKLHWRASLTDYIARSTKNVLWPKNVNVEQHRKQFSSITKMKKKDLPVEIAFGIN